MLETFFIKSAETFAFKKKALGIAKKATKAIPISTNSIVPVTGEFKNLEELRELFNQYENIEKRLDPVFTCGSGVTAAVLAYAYKMVNNDYIPKIYDGSWSEYGKYPA